MFALGEFVFVSGEFAFATGVAAFAGGVGGGACVAAGVCADGASGVCGGMAAACLSAASFFRLASVRMIIPASVHAPYATRGTTIMPTAIIATVEVSIGGA